MKAHQCEDSPLTKLLSVCCISLSRLINTPFTLRKDVLTNIEYEDHSIELHEGAWKEGR